MHLVQVDVVGLQAAQAILARFPDVVCGQPAVIGPQPHGLVDLGGQHDAVAPRAAADFEARTPEMCILHIRAPLACPTRPCLQQAAAASRCSLLIPSGWDQAGSRGSTLTVAARARSLIIGRRYWLVEYLARYAESIASLVGPATGSNVTSITDPAAEMRPARCLIAAWYQREAVPL
ncbi:hypothetical protein G6F22_017070 [Rhizopus arrhizus]|nr:hypothetical protein G6F22_017070 [Rhizopus arrhizus]